jgi:predicted RNase H-like HicB family nuclease
MQTLAVDYPTFSEARKDLKRVYDVSESGRTVTLGRDNYVAAVVNADRLRDFFSRTVAPRVQAQFEDGVWVAFMEGRPFVSEGATLEEAVADLLESLREYAEDWEDHLQAASNHADNWGLVQLINLSTDEQLTEWMNTAQ